MNDNLPLLLIVVAFAQVSMLYTSYRLARWAWRAASRRAWAALDRRLGVEHTVGGISREPNPYWRTLK